MRWSVEEYEYRQEVRDKSITARSARKMRTHTGKGGAVKFPSDYLTAKERKAMNGEVKSFNIHKPMTWADFKAMPNDLKKAYIKMIRHRFDAPDGYIAEMLGCSQRILSVHLADLGCSGPKRGGRQKWNREDFEAWKRGEEVVDASEVEAEMTAEDETSETPAENAPVDPVAPAEPDGRYVIVPDTPSFIVADAATVSFTGNSDEILATLMCMLKNNHVNWTIIKEE